MAYMTVNPRQAGALFPFWAISPTPLRVFPRAWIRPGVSINVMQARVARNRALVLVVAVDGSGGTGFQPERWPRGILMGPIIVKCPDSSYKIDYVK